MGEIGLILVVFAFVCSVIACFSFGAPYWNRLVAAALAFYFASVIFSGAGSLLSHIH